MSVSFSPAIILVEPQLGANIGSVARAMWNCALTDLRLVNPRDGWPNPCAVGPASGATPVLDHVRVYPDVPSATADLQHVFATTARPRDMVKPVRSPRQAGVELRTLEQMGRRCGILFGGERSGLKNEDVVRSEAIISIPSNPVFSSFNLAQAVLLVAYEFLLAGAEGETLPADYQVTPAPTEAVDALLDHLDRELDAAEYYREQNLRPTMQRNLHNVFRRAQLTDQEVRSLRGVIARLAEWRGRRRAAKS